MFLAWQTQLARAWFEMAETGLRTMTQTYATAGRETVETWSRMMTLAPQPAPAPPRSPFPFGAMPFAPFWPQATGSGSPVSAGFGAWNAFPSPFSGPFASPSYVTAFPLGFWAGLSTAAEMNRQQQLMNAAAASFRTAGGHAAAMVLAPFQAPERERPRETPVTWWGWPAPTTRYLS